MTSARTAPLPSLAFQSAGIVLIAANLRPSLMGVGPLLKDIQADTGLSPGVLGLLVTMPVIAFAAISPLAAPLARRFGLERAMLASLVLLALGIVLRSLPGTPALFGGAALLGAAIAIGNVLVPALIRRDFSHRIGPMTSMFVTVLAGVGALGAGLAVPAAALLGWRGSLALWALPAVAGALWWGLVLWRPAGATPGPAPASASVAASASAPSSAAAPAPAASGSVWRSTLAWQVSAYMGLQSLGFYVLVTWLPTLLQEGGLSAVAAGTHAFVFQLACLAGSMAAPLLLGRGQDQRLQAVLASALVLAAYLGIAVSAAWIGWVVVAGLGCGASLALALAFFSLRSHDPLQTAALSGMAQSLGYALAALGPVLFGLLRDASGGWRAPLAMMWVLVALQAWAGMLAGRARRL